MAARVPACRVGAFGHELARVPTADPRAQGGAPARVGAARRREGADAVLEASVGGEDTTETLPRGRVGPRVRVVRPLLLRVRLEAGAAGVGDALLGRPATRLAVPVKATAVAEEAAKVGRAEGATCHPFPVAAGGAASDAGVAHEGVGVAVVVPAVGSGANLAVGEGAVRVGVDAVAPR